MKIKFIGAIGGDVTGSCTLCCARNGTRFLVDCGGYQGGGFSETKQARFPFDPKSIDFVLLTHAHFDHCGRIPDLYNSGFKGRVVCNKVTRDLAIINMLGDEYNDKEVALWKRRFITEEEMPAVGGTKSFFLDNDLQITMLRSSHFLGSCSFTIGWNCLKSDSGKGHWMTKSICFSGDLGGVIDIPRNDENYLSLLKDGFVPFTSTDYFVMESTYGARSRDADYKDFYKRIKRLDEIISVEGTNTFVFACFSMQRTQDVLFDLLYLAMNNRLHKYKIVLDSPTAIRACKIFKQALCELKFGKNDKVEKFRYLNSNFADRFIPALENYVEVNENIDKKIHTMRKFISDVLGFRFRHDNVKILNGCEKGADDSDFDSHENDIKKIYITSSGMFQYGPIVGHLLNRHADDKTAFVITGYCSSTDNGKALSAWCNEESGQRKHNINCESDYGTSRIIERDEFVAKIYSVASYYSGHADADALLRFLFHSTKEVDESRIKKQVTVFLNHGDTPARRNLKARIENDCQKAANKRIRDIGNVILPQATDSFFDLDKGEFIDAPHLLMPFFHTYNSNSVSDTAISSVPHQKKNQKKSKKSKDPMTLWILLIEFWNGFNMLAKKKKSTFRVAKPKNDRWHAVYIGFKIANITLTVEKDFSKVCCGINIPNSQDLYSFLFSQKDEIESGMQEHLHWIEDEGNRVKKILLSKEPSGIIDFQSNDSWLPHYDWFLETIEKFQDVFTPRIQEFMDKTSDNK